jgi:hypothetical protein
MAHVQPGDKITYKVRQRPGKVRGFYAVLSIEPRLGGSKLNIFVHDPDQLAAFATAADRALVEWPK